MGLGIQHSGHSWARACAHDGAAGVTLRGRSEREQEGCSEKRSTAEDEKVHKSRAEKKISDFIDSMWKEKNDVSLASVEKQNI